MTRAFPIPAAVRARHAGWTAELVHSHQVATWRLARGTETRFVKVAVEGWRPSLSAERARLEWASSRLPVPQVLDGGAGGGVEWLLVSGLPGRDATANGLRRDPATLVPILARGLRAFHETRADDCPFDFTLDAALRLARQRVEDRLVIPETDFHAEHRHLTPQEAP